MEEAAKNHTIYINNLNEKIKIPELKQALNAMFSQFGEILEVFAKKSLACRGQAWISFKEPASATQALASMQDFSFHGRPMKIAYAKKKSDAVAKMEGTYIPRPRLAKGEKRRREQQDDSDDEAPTNPPVAPGEGLTAPEVPQFPPGMPPPFGMPPGMPAFNGPPPTFPGAPGPFGMFGFPSGFPPMGPPSGNDAFAAGHGSAASETTANPAPAAAPATENPPNNILVLTGLPEETTDHMLSTLFGQHPGLVEVRQIPGRLDIAFIEYQTDFQAATAKTALQGFKVSPTHALQIIFAKKS